MWCFLQILQKLSDEGWSTDNVFFGCGSALFQKLNRDTLSCAFKCSYVETNGKGVSGRVQRLNEGFGLLTWVLFYSFSHHQDFKTCEHLTLI